MLRRLPKRNSLVIVQFAVFVVLVPFEDSCWSHEEDSPKPYSLAKRYQPTPIPDRIALTWTDDPARSVNITWRTSADVSVAGVQYIEASRLRGDLRSDRFRGFKELRAETRLFQSSAGLCHIHSVQLAHLQPATKYAYRVGDGVNGSEWFHFVTAAATPQHFRFIYFGDAQNEIRSWWSRVVREAHQQAPRAAFMLHAGDLVNEANNDSQWGEWFEAGGWLPASIPVVATPGNHEYSELEDSDTKRLSRHWRSQFAFPENGPKGLEESVYWFDYQGVRLVSLNSNERIVDQAEWLDGVLTENGRTRWTIVTCHHPIYAAAMERDNSELRASWKPVFDRHDVDLVLQGHDHAYTRSGLGGPENLPTGVNVKRGGSVYVVSVSGPKMYHLQHRWDSSRMGSGVQLYQVIDVDADQLRYEARLASGELYDAFVLHKGENGEKALVEKIPNTANIYD